MEMAGEDSSRMHGRSGSEGDHESMFRSMFEHSPIGVVVAGHDDKIVRANEAFCRLLGFTEAELLEITLADLRCPEDREVRASLLSEDLAAGFAGDERYRRKDGEIIWVHVAKAAFENQSDFRFSFVSDISARRGAESAMLLEKERSRAILAAALDGIVTIDERGLIESFNPSAELMYGYSQEEVMGSGANLLLAQTHSGDHSSQLAEFMRTGEAASTGVARDLEGRRQDGSIFPIHLQLSEIQVGEKRSICAFIRDLTEPKKVEEQLRQSQKMEAVGSLASGVAHDFNNLLMGVSGCASIAMECVDSGRSDRMYLAEIKKAADSGSAMTRQLLAFSRKAEVELVVFDLNAAVSRQEALLRRLLGEDIEFSIKFNADDSRVRADLGQFDQVLMNLAVNARDAMPHGGRLTIETCGISLAAVVERAGAEMPHELPAGSYVSLTVTDSGCGMSPETLERVFEPFFTTKEVGRGTGLGLATVYGIIRQFHGHIHVRSVPDTGTRFEILLPLSNGELVSRQLPAHPEIEEPCHGTILLCEDDRLVVMAIRYYLEGAGYRVLKARSGADAIECCKLFSDPIDLLLTDIVLPDQSGDRVAEEAKKLKPEIQVLYMSAHTGEWLKREGRIDHEVETLQKPFDEEFLLARIRKVLGGKAQTTEQIIVTQEVESLDSMADSEAEMADSEATKGSSQSESLAAHGAVLVVEDSSAARLAIAEILKREGWEVSTAENGHAALRLLGQGGPAFDVLLVDYSLPDMKGNVLAGEVHALLPNIAIAYMSGYSDLELDPPGPLLEKPLDLDTLSKTMHSLNGA